MVDIFNDLTEPRRLSHTPVRQIWSASAGHDLLIACRSPSSLATAAMSSETTQPSRPTSGIVESRTNVGRFFARLPTIPAMRLAVARSTLLNRQTSWLIASTDAMRWWRLFIFTTSYQASANSPVCRPEPRMRTISRHSTFYDLLDALAKPGCAVCTIVARARSAFRGVSPEGRLPIPRRAARGLATEPALDRRAVRRCP